ncbi:hypothetical protein QQP08_024355 [Theobroma cacao]|nr:hypothetical protein QQP08_024355 [Theobroma cacao]
MKQSRKGKKSISEAYLGSRRKDANLAPMREANLRRYVADRDSEPTEEKFEAAQRKVESRKTSNKLKEVGWRLRAEVASVGDFKGAMANREW